MRATLKSAHAKEIAKLVVERLEAEYVQPYGDAEIQKVAEILLAEVNKRLA